jgi:hypothetical protein
MRRFVIRFAVLASLLTFAAGCSDDDSPTNGENGVVSFASDVLPIFTANCAVSGCHDASTAEQGMVLTADSAYLKIVGVPSMEVPALQRVHPGDADSSYLVMKLEGTAAEGDRMPLDEPPLTDALIQRIRTWIDEGALNN